jgi:Ca2+-binding RTX toxin-like protein
VSATSSLTSLLQLTNSGTISAPTTGPDGRAIQASSAIIMNNMGGTIAAFDNTRFAITANIQLNLTNNALIRGQIDGGTSLTAGDTITNNATIDGAIFLRDGNDMLINRGTLNAAVNLGAGDDVFDGVGGTQLGVVTGGAGNGYDIVYASSNFTLTGGAEIEILATIDNTATTAINLTGNEFNDYLSGNEGVNVLNGAGGSDYLAGRGGNDIFQFGAASGGDVIVDFVQGQDRIDVSALGLTFAQLQAGFVQAGGNGTINLGGGNSITLFNVTLANLTAADFILTASSEAPAKGGAEALEISKAFAASDSSETATIAFAEPIFADGGLDRFGGPIRGDVYI